MGLQEVIILLVMLLFSSCSPASFSLVSKDLVPENTQENKGDNKIHENHVISTNAGAMVNQSKYDLRGGEARPEGYVGNENEKRSQPNTSPQGGGNGVVPAYAAGAASYRKNHKGGATIGKPCWRKGRFTTMSTATLTYLFMYIMV
ncbi:hypothetical protein SSX86_003427 [Deinandra increscens subsp. villosa]|uniref:Uncharacterized protein n=1 Tax=Deinandra increscens subsp. villosa TaxID=3103831 RepID=A0AAP0DLA3_9ASTR